MSHLQQKNFCIVVKLKFPEYFFNKKILDCGSLDINGNNRSLFENCNYIGIDIDAGPNVDIVSKIHEFNYPDESFDTILSTECFEHDMFYKKSLKNICRLLKPGGLFFFSCATIGRNEHGTIETEIISSPLTSKIDEWCSYYKNLEEKDIRIAINIDIVFSDYEFYIEETHHDLNFWGIKNI